MTATFRDVVLVVRAELLAGKPLDEWLRRRCLEMADVFLEGEPGTSVPGSDQPSIGEPMLDAQRGGP